MDWLWLFPAGRPTLIGGYQYPYIRTALFLALEAYRRFRYPVGDFLRSVIVGDFGGVIARADASQQDYAVLKDYYWYHHNELRVEHKDYDSWVRESGPWEHV